MKKRILLICALCASICSCDIPQREKKRYPDEDRAANAQLALQAIKDAKSGKLKAPDSPAEKPKAASGVSGASGALAQPGGAGGTQSNPNAAPLPNPEPLMAKSERGERVKPKFGVEACGEKEGEKFEVPFFRAGNKEIYVRRLGNTIGDRTKRGANNFTVLVNGARVASITFWGSNKSGYGYPFKPLDSDPYSVSIDEKNSSYTYEQPYLTGDGKRAVAKLSMRGLGDGGVEISWDTGDPDEGVNPWIVFDGHRGKNLTFGGNAFRENSKAALEANKNSIAAHVKGDIEFGDGSPTSAIKIAFDDPNTTGWTTESVRKTSRGDTYSIIWRMGRYPNGSTPQKGKFRIDFGECAVAKNTPPPFGNIDFWAYDATHVPQTSGKNLLQNPSFEQGLRYWRVRPQGQWTPDMPEAMTSVEGGVFGKKAAKLEEGSLYSFPIALTPGKKYVLSFYAKSANGNKSSMNVNIQNAGRGGKYPGKWGFGDFQNKDSHFQIDGEWKRYWRTVEGDAAGIQIVLQAGRGDRAALIDAMQLEESADGKPTDFAPPPFDGNLVTSAYPCNDVSFGEPIGAKLEIFGKSGARGKARITLKNVYYETLFDKTFDVKIGEDGACELPLDFDAGKIGEGIFLVRADYHPWGAKPYTDYFRFSVMRKLENRHATKNIFGTGMFTRAHSNSDAAGKKFMEWGFGSTTWFRPVFGKDYKKNLAEKMSSVELYKKYRISNQLVGMEKGLTPEMEALGNYRDWKQITPEMEKLIEESAYIMVKETPPEVMETFAFGNEEESVTAGRYDDYAKAQLAAYRGAKRANPNVLVAPTHGTSGYSSSRGRDAIDGYLEAALKRGVRYDAVGVHPYGNYDYDPLWDFDENVTYLKSRLKHYGYPDDTPLYMSECGNMCDASIPPWGTSNYDRYKASKPTYDFGNQEIFQAFIYARMYIAALKFHPQLRGCNIWTYTPFLDYNFAPLLLCKAVNTLGNLYPDVEYVADIRPSANVRGYAFKLKDGTGIAAVWTTDINVARSRKKGPVMRVKFDQPVKFFDINSNERSAPVDADGTATIQLTAAPLSIKAKDVSKLAKALQEAEVEDAASDVQVTFQPVAGGGVRAQMRNTTGRRQEGKLKVGADEFEYSLAPKQARNIPLPSSGSDTRDCTLIDWSQKFSITSARGAKSNGSWDMKYFYVPQTQGVPDWEKIPSIPINNYAAGAHAPKKHKEVKASYQLAWDSENLYLRVCVIDANFADFSENWNKPKSSQLLWEHDGSLNVYFDTAADARSKYSKNSDDAQASLLVRPDESGSYDTNDYVYHFAPTRDLKTGRGHVWRWIEVDHQLADGVNMPSKEEASEKIGCQFKRTQNGYEYIITFGKRYLEPIILKRGATCGFGVCLHLLEKLDGGKTLHTGLSNSTESGVHTDSNPQFWPLMILK